MIGCSGVTESYYKTASTLGIHLGNLLPLPDNPLEDANRACRKGEKQEEDTL
jgi:hypothetical protein